MKFIASSNLLVILLGASLFGCSDGGQDGPADLGFTINGHPFMQMQQGAGQVMTNTDVPVPDGYIVELYNNGTAGCLQFQSGSIDTTLQLKFPVNPVGTYAVTIANTVFYLPNMMDGAEAQSGTLSVVAVDTQHIAGTYDVTFVSHEHLQGVFNAPLCTTD